jgi:hypothetical protein
MTPSHNRAQMGLNINLIPEPSSGLHESSLLGNIDRAGAWSQLSRPFAIVIVSFLKRSRGSSVIILIIRAVSRSLPYDWGQSATMLVVIDFALMIAQDRFSTRDYDSTFPEFSGAISSYLTNLMGQKQRTCGNSHSYSNPTSFLCLSWNLVKLQLPPPPNWRNWLGNNLR